jgi:hypothetical protein
MDRGLMPTQTDLIEQARARGVTPERIAADLGIDPGIVRGVFASMDIVAGPTVVKPSDTGACGTITGYNRHRHRSEPRCDACLRARRKQSTGRNGKPRPDKPAPCGTVAAYARHHRAGEVPDDACLAAHRAQCAKSRANVPTDQYRARRRELYLLTYSNPKYVEARRQQRRAERLRAKGAA